MIQKVLIKDGKYNTIILQNSLALMAKYILKRCATTKIVEVWSDMAWCAATKGVEMQNHKI